MVHRHCPGRWLGLLLSLSRKRSRVSTLRRGQNQHLTAAGNGAGDRHRPSPRSSCARRFGKSSTPDISFGKNVPSLSGVTRGGFWAKLPGSSSQRPWVWTGPGCLVSLSPPPPTRWLAQPCSSPHPQVILAGSWVWVGPAHPSASATTWPRPAAARTSGSLEGRKYSCPFCPWDCPSSFCSAFRLDLPPTSLVSAHPPRTPPLPPPPTSP